MNAWKHKGYKKLMSAALTALFAACCLSGCQSSGGSTADIDGSGVRIFISLFSEDTFRGTLVDAAMKTAEEYGATAVMYEAENSIEKQVEHIKQAVSEDYDVIMCAPTDADTALELEAIAGDIPIVFYNSCPDKSVLEPDKYIYVGSDEEVAGQFQAEYILEQLGGQDEINVMVLKGTVNHSATNGRLSGLKDALDASGKKINYVFEDFADWDQATAEECVTLFHRTGKTLDVIASQNDSMALGAIDACKTLGLNVPILGIDATADGCAAIEAGDMDFTVYQSAKGQGEMAVKAAIVLGRGGSVKGFEGQSDDELYIWVPFEKVDSSNVADYH